MPTIILVRHGETHWNREGRAQGVIDSPLTLTGIDQARRYGLRIRAMLGQGEGWRMVLSPLGRCLQTAAILAETAGLDFAAATTDARLMEVDCGAFSGLLKSEIMALRPDLKGVGGKAAWYFQGEGGESWGVFAARLGQWLAGLRAGDKVIAVSHGVAGRVLRGLYLGQDPADALKGDSPQDAVYVLSKGVVERIRCPNPPAG